MLSLAARLLARVFIIKGIGQEENMDAGDFQQLKDYLKENLSIQTETSHGCYGMPDTHTVAIYLEGEKISESTIS